MVTGLVDYGSSLPVKGISICVPCCTIITGIVITFNRNYIVQ
jgi:hypothetical protein